ncbi:MAG TPA: DUF120 domain-containing protein, partial [Candidatus Poseidoniales archaeon]|nr:DUF120 domain-containing protein [Candidatus Poseidoniales archaeon]
RYMLLLALKIRRGLEPVVLGPAMRLSGMVSSGLGRAHVFMAQHHYQEQFKVLIGRSAWPGTLNVKVEGDSLTEYQKLRVSAGLDQGTPSKIESHRIKGFDRDGVSFGGATAFLATFEAHHQSFDCAILIPDLTRHNDVVEVIAGVFLRESCDLDDGDEVSIVLP